MTDDERLARVRFIDAENTDSGTTFGIDITYTIDFLTWDVPAGTL